MDAERLGCAEGIEEHVTLADQFFGTGHVEDGPRIDLAGNGKGDTAGDIGLDEAGQDIDRRPLCSQDEVHPAGPRFLTQADDRLFDVVRCRHHEVCQFVDDDDDERHGIFRMEFIIPGNIPRMSDGEALVAVVHFPDSPAQDAGGFLRIRDDWRQQVRNTVVIR